MKQSSNVLNKEFGSNIEKNEMETSLETSPPAIKELCESFITDYAINQGAGTSGIRPKRLSTTRYANCPLCDSKLTPLNICKHLEKEKEHLSRWHQNMKRRRKYMKTKQVKENEDFLSVKARRNGRSVAMQEKLKPWRNAACPLCATEFSSGASEVFEHIYMCQNAEVFRQSTHGLVEGNLDINSSENAHSSNLSTLVQEAEITSASVMRLSNGDEDLPLDVEILDEEEFGEEQYSKNDVDLLNAKLGIESVACVSETPTPPHAGCSHNSVSSTVDLCAASSSSISQVTSEPGPSNLLQVNKASDEETCDKDSESLKAQLKLKIQELMRDSAVCAVCMGPYKTPLVSINCWHVLCEQCWLQALAVSKLCPLCKDITNPGKLRKLYL